MTKKIDWDGTFPKERTYLGVLGKVGYRGRPAARIAVKRIQHVVNEDNIPPTTGAVSSRMDHGDRYDMELLNIQKVSPEESLKAVEMAAYQLLEFVSLGIAPNFKPIGSAAESADEASFLNSYRRQNSYRDFRRAGCTPGEARELSGYTEEDKARVKKDQDKWTEFTTNAKGRGAPKAA